MGLRFHALLGGGDFAGSPRVRRAVVRLRARVAPREGRAPLWAGPLGGGEHVAPRVSVWSSSCPMFVSWFVVPNILLDSGTRFGLQLARQMVMTGLGFSLYGNGCNGVGVGAWCRHVSVIDCSV